SQIESKNLTKSFKVMESLLALGEEPVLILSTIASATRRMLAAKSLLEEKDYTKNDAAERLRIHSYFAGAFFAGLENYSLKHLKKSLKEVLKADAAIKTGSLDAASALERLLLFLCA
ncbi:MAG: hypothetical protein FWC85_01125, partial [Elusimicrobia bacterium]|nr:hypothetical protein [Elusimicrobiota bacterium]